MATDVHGGKTPPLFLLTAGGRSDSLLLLTNGKRRQSARNRDAKGARRGRETAENAKKILNRGNELKDLLEIKGLAYF